jgi:TM2 domain-containing membrane protein YozV
MKQAFLAALCSAFVIPGLGQILNQQLKKGIIMLGAVLVLFGTGVVEMYRIMKYVLQKTPPANANPGSIIQSLGSPDYLALWIIFGLFAIVWIISVVDAFLAGRRMDRLQKEGR